MRYVLSLLCALFSLASSGYAQELRDRAESDPLDCAYYLLSKNQLESMHGKSLTRTLYNVGRYDDAIRTARIDPDLDFKLGTLSQFGLDRLQQRDNAFASKFSAEAFNAVKDDLDSWSVSALFPLIKLLVGTSQAEKALTIVETQDDQHAKLESLLVLAGAYLEFQDRSSARITLDQVLPLLVSVESEYYALKMADMYIKLGEKEIATQVLDRVERLVALANSENLRHELVIRFYALGNEKRAMSNWDAIPDKNDVHNRLRFAEMLLGNGKLSQSERILRGLSQKELESYMVGREVVKLYLQMGKVELARKAAALISQDPDDYDQQTAFILVADHYIKAKNINAAKQILDTAFQKARKIKFEHLPEQSTGGSAGTRKWIYLRNLSERWQELGNLEQAFFVASQIVDPHPMAQEIFAANIARFAKLQATKLPMTLTLKRFEQALSIVREQDDAAGEIKVLALLAETHAILGKPEKAADVLAELLENRKSEYLEGFALLAAGEVFSQNKLPLTERLRTILIAIINEHDE